MSVSVYSPYSKVLVIGQIRKESLKASFKDDVK